MIQALIRVVCPNCGKGHRIPRGLINNQYQLLCLSCKEEIDNPVIKKRPKRDKRNRS